MTIPEKAKGTNSNRLLMYEATHRNKVPCIIDEEYRLIRTFEDIKTARIYAAALNIIKLIDEEYEKVY